MFTLTGTVKTIGKTQDISEKFRKRELIINEKSGSFEQPIMFEATQDRVDILDGLNAGDDVSVQFHIRGRDWTAKDGTVKHFISLNAFRVDKVGAGEGAAAPPPPSAADIPADMGEDDLPF